MSQQQLPPADQPDNYTGNWNRHRVRYLYVDPAAGLWHLGVGDEYQGTYCTRMNPLARIDLAGVKLRYRNGGYLIVPRDGAEVSIFMPHKMARRRPMTYHDQVPEVCPNCLTMAVVQAEMRGQNTYPVVSLCQQLDQLPGAPGKS